MQKAFVLCRLFDNEKTKGKLKRALAHVSPALEVQAQNQKNQVAGITADKVRNE